MYLSITRSKASIPLWSLTRDSIKSISILAGSFLTSNLLAKLCVEPKNNGPQISYLAPFSLMRLRARIRTALSQANFWCAHDNTGNHCYGQIQNGDGTSDEYKSNGCRDFPNDSKVDQANVPMTTINITPTNAAIGICSISGAPKRTNDNRPRAATTPESRPRPPEC